MDSGGAVGLADVQGRDCVVRRRDGAWRETLVIGNGAHTATTQLAKPQLGLELQLCAGKQPCCETASHAC